MASQNKTLSYIVPIEDSGLRLDQFLSLKNSDLSRTRIKSLIDNGYVKKIINDSKTKSSEPSKKVKLEEKYELTIPSAVDPKPIGQKIPLDVLHEDDDIIAVSYTHLTLPTILLV